MQTAAAADLISMDYETPATRELCVVDREPTSKFGHACLQARRIAQRDVRDNPLTNNDRNGPGECAANHKATADRADQPIADLISDSKQHSFLHTTPVILAAAFGRTPVMQGSDGRVCFYDKAGFEGTFRVAHAMCRSALHSGAIRSVRSRT